MLKQEPKKNHNDKKYLGKNAECKKIQDAETL